MDMSKILLEISVSLPLLFYGRQACACSQNLPTAFLSTVDITIPPLGMAKVLSVF
jgi:hypothetical protein